MTLDLQDSLNQTLKQALTPGQTWLVTGGAGFIGTHLCQTLLRQGLNVVCLDNLEPFYNPAIKQGNLVSLQALGAEGEPKTHGQFTFIQADITQPQAMAEALKPYAEAIATGGIVHLAAKAGVRPSLVDPAGYLQTNVTGTLNMLEWAKTAGVKAFVFGSSSSVYGAQPLGPNGQPTEAFTEPMACGQPISPYAATKAMGEQLLYTYHHLYDLNVMALRFFTVYGPAQRPDLAIHKFAYLMQAGQPLPFFGDGTTRRDYTYIEDIVAGIVAACGWVKTCQSSGQKGYEIVNLGGGQTVSLSEMVAALEAGLGLKAQLNRQPLPAGDVPLTYADTSRARALLGYVSQTPFKQGLAQFLSWFKATS